MKYKTNTTTTIITIANIFFLVPSIDFILPIITPHIKYPMKTKTLAINAAKNELPALPSTKSTNGASKIIIGKIGIKIKDAIIFPSEYFPKPLRIKNNTADIIPSHTPYFNHTLIKKIRIISLYNYLSRKTLCGNFCSHIL